MKTLVKNSGGRWCVTEVTLTCGSGIVAYINGKGWIRGDIQHNDKYGGYYFYSEKEKVWQPLSEDLEVRTIEEQTLLEREARKLK